MAIVNQYAVYAGRVERVNGNVFITPLDNLDNGYYPDVSVYDFSQGASTVLSDGYNQDVGFGMRVLKNGKLLPHNLILLQIDEQAAGYTPAPGLSNNALQDAVSMGLAAHGGYAIAEDNALLLAKHLFPAFTVNDAQGKTYTYSDPYLSNGIIMRDCTVA